MKNLLAAAALIATSSALSPMSHAASPGPLSIARLFADPALSGTAPTNLKIAPDGARVTFLRGRPDAQNDLDLWSYDIASGKTGVLVTARALLSGPEALSDEEKARRERLRISSSTGIVDYQFAPDGKKLLFPLGGQLYLYDLAREGAEAVTRLTHGDGFITDPRLSPRGRYATFVRDRKLILLEIETLEETVLGHGDDPLVSWGTAEFVAQEEMDRFTGYWWAPDESAIALTRVDESAVPVQKRFEVYADRSDIIEQRYPAAGQDNAKVALYVVRLAELAHGVESPSNESLRPGDFADASFDHHRTVVYRKVDLGPNEDQYLARVQWLPDAKSISFQRQSRDQRKLELVAQDLATGQQRVLVTETAKTWVPLTDDLRFLSGRNGLIWGSQRNGSAQLLWIDETGKSVRELTPRGWQVDRLLALDEKKKLVYFSGHDGHDPLVKHVFAAALEGKATPKRISSDLAWHEASFAGDASVFVDTASDTRTPPSVALFAADGKRLAVLEANTLDGDHPYAPFRAAHQSPHYGTLSALDGQTLWYGYVTPPDFDPTKRYPVIVRYYGGPGRQFVNRSWTTGVNTGFTDLLSQYWAQQGYIVFSLDNRGTPRRGKAFEDAIFRRLGYAEIEDQLTGIDWLTRQPWVDAQRIGCFGWSYGGFQTLMLLAKGGTRVAAGAAVAPVTDWALYDTHYTERYMDHPAANARGYKNSSPITHAAAIKSPLLLMHGMADDNVLFSNTTQMMSALVDAGVPFELMTYPGAKHGITGQKNRTHVYSTIDSFFSRRLLTQPAAPPIEAKPSSAAAAKPVAEPAASAPAAEAKPDLIIETESKSEAATEPATEARPDVISKTEGDTESASDDPSDSDGKR